MFGFLLLVSHIITLRIHCSFEEIAAHKCGVDASKMEADIPTCSGTAEYFFYQLVATNIWYYFKPGGSLLETTVIWMILSILESYA